MIVMRGTNKENENHELWHVCEYCYHEFDRRAAFGHCPNCGGHCMIVPVSSDQSSRQKAETERLVPVV